MARLGLVVMVGWGLVVFGGVGSGKVWMLWLGVVRSGEAVRG